MKHENSEHIKNVVFIVPVWGEEYCHLFVETCLPLLQTPGNLGFFDRLEKERKIDCCLKIVTNRDSLKYINNSKSVLKKENMIDYEIVCNDEFFDEKNPYETMTKSYHLAMNLAFDSSEECIFYYLTPDSFASENSFKNTWKRIESGKRAVVVTGIRAMKSTAVPELQKVIKSNQSVIGSREMTDIALRHFHKLYEVLIWNDEQFQNNWPSIIFFRRPNGDMMAHAFHMHPLAVVISSPMPSSTDTIDGEFLQALKLKAADFHVVTDSDECLVVELSPDDRFVPIRKKPARKRAIAWFGLTVATPIHWHFFMQRAVWRGTGQRGHADSTTHQIDDVIRYMQWFRLPALIFHYLGFQKIRLRFGTVLRNQMVKKVVGMFRSIIQIC